jgi:hypothetical protein
MEFNDSSEINEIGLPEETVKKSPSPSSYSLFLFLSLVDVSPYQSNQEK